MKKKMKGPRLDDIHGFAHSFSSKVKCRQSAFNQAMCVFLNACGKSKYVKTLKLLDQLYMPTLRLLPSPNLI
jgi:hypothetical protein